MGGGKARLAASLPSLLPASLPSLRCPAVPLTCIAYLPSPHTPSLPAETNFKTQVEADIQPFRGILLGLFFVTTGSSLDVRWVGWLMAGAKLRHTWCVAGTTRFCMRFPPNGRCCSSHSGTRPASQPAAHPHPAPAPRPSLPRRSLLLQQWPLVLTLLAGLLATKIAIISALGPLFGLSRAESVRTGFILSQVRGRGGW